MVDKLCFLVVGPECSGNRLVAALLVRAGCVGEATAHHGYIWNTELPTEETPAVVVRSYPHGDEWPDLAELLHELQKLRGYAVTVLVTTRDWSAQALSQTVRGQDPSIEAKRAAYEDIFADLAVADHRDWHLVSHESLVLHPEAAVSALLHRLGLPPVSAGQLVVEGQAQDLFDANARRYAVGEVPLDRAARELMPGLLWSPERQVGYYPVHGQSPYDEAYFEKYREYASTELGRKLTQARVDLVNRHWTGELVDVGIGCGQFIEARANTWGYDVNPAGVAWLRERGLWWDPFDPGSIYPPAVSCWDSFEHLPDPDRLLERPVSHVFLSLPIFTGPDHALRSKHFRPTEHYWYFTRPGLVRYFEERGFELLEHSLEETRLGREDIEAFAFKRP